MSHLYNTVFDAYSAGFETLGQRAKFHFASRLYLWNHTPVADRWLEELRPWFTAEENPRKAVVSVAKAAPPPMKQTAGVRRRFFEKYPALQPSTRALFRLNFLAGIYGIDQPELLNEVIDETSAVNLRTQLLADDVALIGLSSFALNYLYLHDGYIKRREVPVQQLLDLARSGFDSDNLIERQLQLYFYSHCVIGQSLFYRRRVEASETYTSMLSDMETIIERHLDDIKLDNLFEFLVSCRLLNHKSQLEDRILSKAEANLTDEGFIAEPSDDRQQTLGTAEHRNVLYLMSQQTYEPSNSGL